MPLFKKYASTEIALTSVSAVFERSQHSGNISGNKPMSPLYTRRVTEQTLRTIYHPVSLTSLIYKIMEHILMSQIMKHLESNDILTEVQYESS